MSLDISRVPPAPDSRLPGFKACRASRFFRRFQIKAPLIKICGLSTPKEAGLAASLGADLCGFIFHPPSPRAAAPGIVAAIETPGALRVGVFVRQGLCEIEDVMGEAKLDMAQLHGDQGVEVAAALGPERVIRVFWPERFARAEAPQKAEPGDGTPASKEPFFGDSAPEKPFSGDFAPGKLSSGDLTSGGSLSGESAFGDSASRGPAFEKSRHLGLEDAMRAWEKLARWFLFDAGLSDGGHGRKLEARFKSPAPYFLAGGLTAEEIKRAWPSRDERLAGFDLSSSLESSPGRKAPEAIKNLFAALAPLGVRAKQ